MNRKTLAIMRRLYLEAVKDGDRKKASYIRRYIARVRQ